MPKLRFETWTCGDPADDCNAVRLFIDDEEVAFLDGLLFSYLEIENQQQRELRELLLKLGLPKYARDVSIYSGLELDPKDECDFFDWDGEEVDITEAQAKDLILLWK